MKDVCDIARRLALAGLMIAFFTVCFVKAISGGERPSDERTMEIILPLLICFAASQIGFWWHGGRGFDGFGKGPSGG